MAREEKRVFSEIHGGHPVKEKRVFEKFFQKFMEGQETPCHPSKSVTVKEKRVFEKFFQRFMEGQGTVSSVKEKRVFEKFFQRVA